MDSNIQNLVLILLFEINFSIQFWTLKIVKLCKWDIIFTIFLAIGIDHCGIAPAFDAFSFPKESIIFWSCNFSE